ncbi:MAG: alkaline phosphatase [Caulobacterales bacterium]
MVRLSLTAALLSLAVLAPNAVAQVQDKRSAVFLHPDGMGANTWTAIRLKEVGPDGRLAWDQLPAAAAYVGPLLDRVTATSNGGGTSHAWGVRAASASFGFPAGAEAASGAPMPLMLEAKRAGKAIAIINSASVTDAGTGTQLASVGNRRNHTLIAAKMLSAEPDLLLGGGEKYFLPQGVAGVHGQGVRQDGRNLIEEARAKGYRIVRTRTELLEAAKTKGKILGLFSTDNTFQEGSEEQVAASGKPLFEAQAPRYDEMVAVALNLLADAPNGFYLMAEEEATDNLGGDNNASGVLDAGAGADRAIAAALAAAKANPNLTVVVASDSDCGGLQATGDDAVAGEKLPPATKTGSPIDGVGGAATVPFLAAPDEAGMRWPFAITWASEGDMSGGGIVRATGPGAALVFGTVDSTDVYRALHAGLFGVKK